LQNTALAQHSSAVFLYARVCDVREQACHAMAANHLNMDERRASRSGRELFALVQRL